MHISLINKISFSSSVKIYLIKCVFHQLFLASIIPKQETEREGVTL